VVDVADLDPAPHGTATSAQSAMTSSQQLISRYRRASFPQRIGALMVDALLFFCFVAVPAWVISWAFGPGGFDGCDTIVDETCTISSESLRYTRTVFYGLWIVWAFVFARSISRGASVGKRAVEILVIDATTGETISYKRALARTVLSVLSVACVGLGLLWALTNKERRAAHDLVMGTRVISN